MIQREKRRTQPRGAGSCSARPRFLREATRRSQEEGREQRRIWRPYLVDLFVRSPVRSPLSPVPPPPTCSARLGRGPRLASACSPASTLRDAFAYGSLSGSPGGTSTQPGTRVKSVTLTFSADTMLRRRAPLFSPFLSLSRPSWYVTMVSITRVCRGLPRQCSRAVQQRGTTSGRGASRRDASRRSALSHTWCVFSASLD